MKEEEDPERAYFKHGQCSLCEYMEAIQFDGNMCKGGNGIMWNEPGKAGWIQTNARLRNLDFTLLATGSHRWSWSRKMKVMGSDLCIWKVIWAALEGESYGWDMVGKVCWRQIVKGFQCQEGEGVLTVEKFLSKENARVDLCLPKIILVAVW